MVGLHPDNSFYTPDKKLASYPCRSAEPRWAGRRASNPPAQPTAHGLVQRGRLWGIWVGGQGTHESTFHDYSFEHFSLGNLQSVA